MPAAAEIRQFLVVRLAELAAERGLGDVEIAEGFHFFDSGLLDSFGFINLLTDAEEEFSVEVDFTELDPEEFSTLDGLTATLAQATS
ncbi:MAG TPA: phosphopantetheine-binding protein [Iamia sp.]